MNGLGVALHSLADTGANGYLFLNRHLAVRLSRALNVKIQQLPYTVPIRGYQSQIQSHVSEYIRLHLTIDNRRIYNCPFVIIDLGEQDMIIGRKWMSRFKILLDPENSRFIWPSEHPPTPLWSKELLIPFNSRALLKNHINHQQDADRRNTKLDTYMKRSRDRHLSLMNSTSINTSSSSSILNPLNKLRQNHGTVAVATEKQQQQCTWQRRQNFAYKKMNKILACSTDPPSATSTAGRSRYPAVSVPTTTPILNICQISANAFHYNMKRKENEFFQTSLYEIDRVINELEEGLIEDNDTLQLIHRKLPKSYTGFEDVFSKAESDRLPPHRFYDHKIQLEAPLPNSYSPLYRQSTEELRVMKEYLIEHLKKGFVANSSSPFASPVLFVKKKDGSLRFCIDYRKLNALTRNDPYPIPRIDELLSRVSKAKLFTKLDIRQAFHRIRVDPESEEYTTFRTRYGSYKCKVLPFGLTNGPATYQRYMNDVLMDYLDEFCMAYLDDILIYSEDPLQHEEQVKKVLTRLREAGLQADIKKCEFHVERTQYLGYILTTKGIEVDSDKVEPLRNWARPTTITAVKSFLGFCGFYRQFIRNFGKIAKPLTTITRPSEPFRWTDSCETAFEKLKLQLLSIPSLYHFDPEFPTKLETDASDGVIAGVLSQRHSDEQWYPSCFYSHVLVGHESNWEIHDKELFAIIEAFRKWRPELISARSRIEVYSDHRSLEYFMTTKILTAKQVRWMEFLSDFNFRIMYTAGKNNQKADILSRREQDVAAQELFKRDSRSRTLLGPERLDPRINAELAQIFVATTKVTLVSINSKTEPEPLFNSTELIQKLRQDNLNSFRLLRPVLPKNYSTEDGLLLYQGRLCVNRHTPLCTQLIKEAHAQPSSAHPGGVKTYQLLATKYHWVGMSSDCKRYVRNCLECRYAHSNQTKQQGLLHPLPIPAYPMQHLCMDFKSFPKDEHGFDCILVFIDRLGKDSVTIPCHKTIDARGMARLFIQWIYRFGHTPESIVSDRGPQFVSSFWSEFCRIIGVKIKLSTAYHKQTDGQTEIMNKYIDQRLRPFVSYYQDNWSDLLPLIDRAQITLPHSTIGMAPYRLKFGVDPRTSWDWKSPKPTTPLEKLNYADAYTLANRMHKAWEIAKNNMEKAQEKMQRSTNRHRRPTDWQVKDKVFLSTKNLKNDQPSRKLVRQWEGPFTVTEKVGNSYRLALPDGSKIHDVFAADVLIKDPNDPLPGQVNPKPTGQIIEGVEEWEVDKILAVQLLRGKLKYKASWVGHDPDPQWYPASNFIGSPYKIRDFHNQYPDKPGPPRRLPEWIHAWEAGTENYSHLEDDRPASESHLLPPRRLQRTRQN
jgi:hypothetical protein